MSALKSRLNADGVPKARQTVRCRNGQAIQTAPSRAKRCQFRFGKTLQSQRVLKIAARRTGVGHDKNFITGIMKIYCGLKHAQMHLQSGNNNLFSSAVLDYLADGIVFVAGESVLFVILGIFFKTRRKSIIVWPKTL